MTWSSFVNGVSWRRFLSKVKSAASSPAPSRLSTASATRLACFWLASRMLLLVSSSSAIEIGA